MATSKRRHTATSVRTRAPRRAPQPVVAGIALAVLGWATVAGCGPAGDRAPRGDTVLLVANSRDGTLTRIAAGSGDVVGAPLPGGDAPWQIVAGSPGGALTNPVSPSPSVRLTHVSSEADGWRARPLPLESGARSALLAGGGRHAVVAYQRGDFPAAAPGARCRVVAVDVEHGALGAPRDVCADRDSVVGLARSGDGALVYVALWRRPAAGQPCDAPTGSRVLALRAATGTPVAAVALDGVPGPLVVAPGPGGVGHRLYATEGLTGPDLNLPGESPPACAAAGYGRAFEGAWAWRVWALDATTLAPDGEHAVPYPVRALAVTPDGDDAFVLAGRAAVLRLGAAGAPAAAFATLPDVATGLAATDDRVFTLDVFGDRVWSLDRRAGQVIRTIPTGRAPLGLALAAPDRP